MENQKIKIFLLFICSVIIFLSSCASNTISTNNTDITKQSDLISNAANNEKISSVSQIDPKYEKIKFGDTQDILLLDVEWHTPETYEEMMLEEFGNDDKISEDELKWIDDNINKIKSGEEYIAKTANGKSYILRSENPYNNRYNENPLADSQIDPGRYYIFNIYPFYWNIYYTDEKGEYQYKFFNAENELDFYLIKDDIISYCDELLVDGKITQEEYNQYAIKSPLDYYVRQCGWFGEEDLKNYPLKEYTFPPTPDVIANKNDFSILFVGNSFTYSGILPKQLSQISEMYGITVTSDSITSGGALLSESMDKAIAKMQEKQYDYLVLQEGNRGTEDFYSAVETLCEEARKLGIVPVMYNPAWVNIDKKPNKEAQLFNTAQYIKAAKIGGAILVNAGDAWVYAYDKYPDLNLYADDIHANNAGAYLTACVFASTLFNLHIKDIEEDNTYHGDDAIRLGQAAWEYVQYYNEHEKSPTEIITVPDGTN